MLIGVYGSRRRRKCQGETKKKEIRVLKDARKKRTSMVNLYKAGTKATQIKENGRSTAVE
jgi:hypothetical protein